MISFLALSVTIQLTKTSFNLKNLGHHWIENSLAIASVLSALDKDVNYYLKKLFNFVAVKGRGKILNIKYKNKKIVFIDDTYNSSPESLKLSINFLNHLGNKRRKIVKNKQRKNEKRTSHLK